mmetsp:Transcript_12663/g.19054  ORF Transcript_12663/g.19054 Transcript_12663/m.19054 type:complete len:542 (-) Transcript_12663:451-2076(-)|eukprot:CAMPEP_0196814472 /NCGR_PEP_ID=MMETSP1362-20130617/43462_1 /TAXON_ID=163516 /ORGANISM="Leptocylindrus danicus, Strain CCMP1856" /LENGTH=541 /DNA_ID=CAMNT_0042191087 /DNA_START=278 /DNA_END=1903 /DNA_ORIENTATION=-
MSLARAKDSMLRLDNLIAQHEAEEADRLLEVCDDDDDAIGPTIEGDDDGDDYFDVGTGLEDEEEEVSPSVMQTNPSFSNASIGGDADAGTEPPIGEAVIETKEEQVKKLFNYSGMSDYSNYGVPQVVATSAPNQGQYRDTYEDYYQEYDEDFADVFCCLTPWASKQEDKSLSSSDTASAWSSSSTPFPAPGFDIDASAADAVASSRDIFENVEEAKKPLKGILKKNNSFSQSNAKLEDSRRSSVTSNGGQRRSLFPNAPQVVDTSRQSFSGVGINKSNVLKNLRWASMARVSMVPSRLDFSYAERTSVWWQRSDYDEFKKAGRIITKAMTEGGSEIWLRSSASVKHNPTVNGEEEEHGDKWWCKFGHSRRGLEHVTNIEEGKHRQKNVVLAIQAVMDEQRKQRILNKHDPGKLSIVASSYTSFARDIARQNGIKDETAMVEIIGKNSYLDKQMTLTRRRSINRSVQPAPVQVDQKPKNSFSSDFLDANTSSREMIKLNPTSSQPSRAGCENKAKSIAGKAAGFGSGATLGTLPGQVIPATC